MRATDIQIIFISKNPALVNTGIGEDSPMTDEERELWNALQEGVNLANEKYNIVNSGIPMYYMDYNYYNGTQSVQIERWGIGQFPAVRLIGSYPDGKKAHYTLKGTITDLKKYTPEEIAKYLNALATGNFGGQPSLLCQLFPPACKIGLYGWLAIATVSTVAAVQGKGAKQFAYGAFSALSWNEFFKRGGFPGLQSGSAPKQIEQ